MCILQLLSAFIDNVMILGNKLILKIQSKIGLTMESGKVERPVKGQWQANRRPIAGQ
jgi:hypothetical protein